MLLLLLVGGLVLGLLGILLVLLLHRHVLLLLLRRVGLVEVLVGVRGVLVLPVSLGVVHAAFHFSPLTPRGGTGVGLYVCRCVRGLVCGWGGMGAQRAAGRPGFQINRRGHPCSPHEKRARATGPGRRNDARHRGWGTRGCMGWGLWWVWWVWVLGRRGCVSTARQLKGRWGQP